MKQEQVISEQITEGNELIAKFDGWEIVTVGYYGQHHGEEDDETEWQSYHRGWLDKMRIESVGRYIVKVQENDWFEYEDMRYHKSWNLLMPVVEKIGDARVKSLAPYNSDLMFKIEIVNGYTKIEGTGERIFYNSSVEGSMIAATFKAVIHFIKWYNSYTTKPQP